MVAVISSPRPGSIERMPDAPSNDQPRTAPRCDHLVVAWAVTLAVLMAVTWPLWTPLRSVPRVAPFAWQAMIPAGIDWLLLALVVVGLGRSLVKKHVASLAILIASLGLAELMSLDQLRWQPWAYHALLAGVTLGLGSPRQAIGGLRLLAIAVYAFSAIAKLDAEFAATLGQQMLDVISGGAASALSEEARTALALLLPAVELALALLLAASMAWPRLAKVACLAAVFMHATTIVVLSPWGLNHSWGVLLWNVGFAWQTVVLFWPSAAIETAPSQTERSRLVTAVLAIGILAPLGTPFGLWDQWPGWALYAPGGERARVYVLAEAAERLPAAVQEHVEPSRADGPWRRVEIDEWVLSETGAPLYPQNRLVAALAAELAEAIETPKRVKLVAESAADRFTRKRRSETHRLAYQIESRSRLLGFEPAVVWTQSDQPR